MNIRERIEAIYQEAIAEGMSLVDIRLETHYAVHSVFKAKLLIRIRVAEALGIRESNPDLKVRVVDLPKNLNPGEILVFYDMPLSYTEEAPDGSGYLHHWVGCPENSREDWFILVPIDHEAFLHEFRAACNATPDKGHVVLRKALTANETVVLYSDDHCDLGYEIPTSLLTDDHLPSKE